VNLPPVKRKMMPKAIGAKIPAKDIINEIFNNIEFCIYYFRLEN